MVSFVFLILIRYALQLSISIKHEIHEKTEQISEQSGNKHREVVCDHCPLICFKKYSLTCKELREKILFLKFCGHYLQWTVQ